MPPSPSRFNAFLRWTERYTKTDMVYLFQNGGWLIAGQAASLVFSLALAIIFGHYASQDTYGNYKYILSVASVLGVLSLSGLGTAVVRAVARGEEGALSQGFRLSIKWSGALLAVGVVAAAYYWLAGNHFVTISLVVATVTLPFINGFSLYDAFLTGRREFRLDTLFLIGSTAFTAVALVATLFFTQRAIVLVAVYFVTNVATDFLWYVIASRRAANRATDPGLARYGAHLSVMNLLEVAAEKIDSIAIFILLGPAPLAVYLYAIAMPEQFKGVTKSIANLSLAKFAARPLAEIKSSIGRRLLVLGIGSGIATGAYIAIAPLLFRYLFPVYIESVPYSQWYALMMVPTGIATVLVTALQAHQKTRALYIANSAGQVALIIGLPVFTFFYGIAGAIASQLIYRILILCLSVWQFRAARDTEPSAL